VVIERNGPVSSFFSVDTTEEDPYSDIIEAIIPKKSGGIIARIGSRVIAQGQCLQLGPE
jgi:hypothetical protein